MPHPLIGGPCCCSVVGPLPLIEGPLSMVREPVAIVAGGRVASPLSLCMDVWLLLGGRHAWQIARWTGSGLDLTTPPHGTLQ